MRRNRLTREPVHLAHQLCHGWLRQVPFGKPHQQRYQEEVDDRFALGGFTRRALAHLSRAHCETAASTPCRRPAIAVFDPDAAVFVAVVFWALSTCPTNANPVTLTQHSGAAFLRPSAVRSIWLVVGPHIVCGSPKRHRFSGCTLSVRERYAPSEQKRVGITAASCHFELKIRKIWPTIRYL